ncbi:Vacuolar protein-sorting-associated protein 36 [Candida viswanathii]|uniref:Vacuolar protein-sorting-associated protein 36 n=1 Tax=Candida viswanathii TaxID=5486 RepID=A0A367YQT1_9ASCO|nr:Vacuolar protein-sorting-associated protein 36 [Candida viswanathii]
MSSSWLNIWQPVLINRSNRPILQDNEYNIYIRDNVGLYQGRSKILEHQNGRIYLTNRRLIYFDNDDVKNCIAVELSQFKKAELVVAYFRKSPKVTLYIKTTSTTTDKEDGDNAKASTVTNLDWVCKICSFNNHVLSNFKIEEDELPKCTSCGIRPAKAYLQTILEAGAKPKQGGLSPESMTPEPQPEATSKDQCPKCTFINHPALNFCEMCGTELKQPNSTRGFTVKNITGSLSNVSINSNPLNLKLEGGEETYTNNEPYIKLSFRKGGETKFHQDVSNILDEIKWKTLEERGGINKNGVKLATPDPKPEIQRKGGAGIHALEQLGELQRKQNEIILSSSLDDLEQLMFKYQDLIKLSTSFNKLVKQQPTSSSKPVIPALNIKKTSSLYHQELSRHISEFAINYRLTQKTSMISSQDLFAEYNRFLIRNQGFGSELITSTDFQKAIELFDVLKLPIVVKKYVKSDIYVISPRSNTNTYGEYIVDYLKNQEYEYKLMKLREEMMQETNMDNDLYNAVNYGKTVSEISNQFNWSYNITTEELDKCVEEGLIVIDHHISGTFYYINKFTFTDSQWDESKTIQDMKALITKEQLDITNTIKNDYLKQNLGNLVDLNPDYEFFSEVAKNDSTPQPDDDMESLVTANMSETTSQSLNDLAGLKF